MRYQIIQKTDKGMGKSMAQILIVEDDKSINELMVRYLKMTGHTCLTAFTGGEALSVLKKEHTDLILLDISLPDMDGFAVKELAGAVPVIFVTARNTIKDRIRGLNDGAEDYIGKPFDFQELLARVNVVLRRYGREQDFCLGAVRVDLKNFKVYENGKELSMTPQEFELLRALIINKNVTLSRQQLLNAAWGFDYEGEERTVDVHIQRIRKKLHLEEYIKTIYKIGYRLEV